MARELHPLAPHSLPIFVTGPGETDILFVITTVVLLVFLVLFGVLFFRLHHLPEHVAHKSKKVQLEIVAVLSLLSMFTQVHIFWIAALILAYIDIPPLSHPFQSMARSLEKIAGINPMPAEIAERSSQYLESLPVFQKQDGVRLDEYRSIKRDK